MKANILVHFEDDVYFRLMFHPFRLVFSGSDKLNFQYKRVFSGSQAQMKTAVLYHRSAETYPSDYKTGTSTIFQILFSKQI